jgi:hypothetical protein
MDDFRAFAVAGALCRSIRDRPFRSEAKLRRFVVRHARILLAVRVLATEFPIATDGGGRIDALGLDTAGAPVILEFKRVATGLTICQGLYYLDWLDHHRDVFASLVTNSDVQRIGRSIAWKSARLVCVAEEIGLREEAVARQIGRSVELLQIRRYVGGLATIQRPRSTA